MNLCSSKLYLALFIVYDALSEIEHSCLDDVLSFALLDSSW